MLDWDDEIITKKETSKMLKVSVRTVDRIAPDVGLRRLQLSPRRVGYLRSTVVAFRDSLVKGP